ncbi:MAG TPA: helix-turn-helix domain-containing protein [Thermoleophilia bacterium]|nr:helix-turn-helix domain-containing protein [Thermoleophilia bacterium]
MGSTKAGVPCQCVYRSLVLLEALAEHPSARLTDLAREVSLNKATAHRLLATMQARGFVVQSEMTQEYSLGPRISELDRAHSEAVGAAVGGGLEEVVTLRPEAAREQLGEGAEDCGVGSCALA